MVNVTNRADVRMRLITLEFFFCHVYFSHVVVIIDRGLNVSSQLPETFLERAARIELASSAWKAEVLPLHNARALLFR